jgi:MFS family permease
LVSERLPRDFWRFWTASTVSNLGDGIRLVALPLLAVRLTDDPLVVSGILALAFLPWVIVGPISGAIVDRVDRRRLIIIVQLCRAVVALAFATAVASGSVVIWMLYLTAFAIAVGETLVDSAAQAAVPQLVPTGQLERANGRVMAGQLVTNEIVGSPIGGILFAIGATIPFLIDGATYLLGALLLITLRSDLRPTDRTGRPPSTLRADVFEGLHHVWRDPLLRPLAWMVGVANLGLGAQGAVFVLFAVEVIGVSEAGYGFLIGFGAAGGVVGAWVSDLLVLRVGRTRALLGVTVALSAGLLLLAGAREPLSTALALAIVIGAAASFSVIGQALRQALAPRDLLGRVITGFRLIGMSAVPVGATLGGLLARSAGLRAPLVAASLCVSVAAIMQLRFLPTRRLDHLHSEGSLAT